MHFRESAWSHLSLDFSIIVDLLFTDMRNLVLLAQCLFLNSIFLLQDILFLACTHPENRGSLTKMEEWPEWILEILISNYEV